MTALVLVPNRMYILELGQVRVNFSVNEDENIVLNELHFSVSKDMRGRNIKIEPLGKIMPISTLKLENRDPTLFNTKYFSVLVMNLKDPATNWVYDITNFNDKIVEEYGHSVSMYSDKITQMGLQNLKRYLYIFFRTVDAEEKKVVTELLSKL